MFYTYVIRSKKDGRLYTGSTNDLRKRFKEHQDGKVFSTKGRGPFDLIYYEACVNEHDARVREKYLKSGMGKRYLKNRMKRFLSLTGFTLIELLIAVLIFSIMVAIIYSSFSTGTSVWQRTKNATQVSMKMNSVLDDMARDLRGAVKYKGLDFTGEKDKLYFSYLSETVTDEITYREIYRACYSVAPSTEKKGKLDLIRKRASLAGGGFDIDNIEGRRLVNSLNDFKIEYAQIDAEGGITWQDKWEDAENIPGGMRITIGKENIKLTRYISLPCGELAAAAAE